MPREISENDFPVMPWILKAEKDYGKQMMLSAIDFLFRELQKTRKELKELRKETGMPPPEVTESFERQLQSEIELEMDLI